MDLINAMLFELLRLAVPAEGLPALAQRLADRTGVASAEIVEALRGAA